MAKNRQRRIMDRTNKISTLLGAGSKFEGLLEGTDSVMVHGEVLGDCDLQGLLILDKGGTWKGRIRARNVIIAGTLEGDAKATQNLEVAATAHITGSLSAHALAIEEGAVVEGGMSTSSDAGVARFEERRSGAQGH
jgi:cytoskeletal protein CcmA (bactofilin family)